MPWYFLTPPTGATLAIAFYLVVRGGFLASGTSAADVNLFAFAGIGVLVRLFADLATSKLGSIQHRYPNRSQKEQSSDKPNNA